MKNVPTNARTSQIAKNDLKYIYKQGKANLDNMEETMKYARKAFMFCLITEVAGNQEKYEIMVSKIKREVD